MQDLKKATAVEHNKIKEMASSIRVLSALAVEKAASGHPGLPLGMADVVSVLAKYHLNFDNTNPNWINRDRLILSAGHGSALIYSLLYLLKYPDITLEDIKKFRQLGSKTAGHPEYSELQGIETTTGPLGQGIANACGMAIAQKVLSAHTQQKIIDHKIYVIAGDGCLMEGISYEACSLAGHLGLDNLILIYDDNSITIDGSTDLSFSEDITKRFESMQWNVIEMDGHDFDDINKKLTDAKNLDGLASRPTLIKAKTTIAKGAQSVAGTSKAHGSPLGSLALNELLTSTNWQNGIVKDKPVAKETDLDPYFKVGDEILSFWQEAILRAKDTAKAWQTKHNKLTSSDQEIISNLSSLKERKELAEKCRKLIKDYFLDNKTNTAVNSKAALANYASRISSANVLSEIVKGSKFMIGGSADLTPSNGTFTKNHTVITKDNFLANYLHYGIREHAMAGIVNGMTLYGLTSYCGTFLVFSDYMRPSIRLSALMEIGSIFILTHDSIGLGEDGPTHQPIEHLSSLRAIPNLQVLRPADDLETLECWEIALASIHTPSALCLTRQSLKSFRTSKQQEVEGNKDVVLNLSKLGAYPLNPELANPDIILFASGSEVELAIKVQELLAKEIKNTIQVYSCPCLELFVKRGGDKLIADKFKVFIEASEGQSFAALANHTDLIINISTFGSSAKASDLFKKYGFDEIVIANKVLASFKKQSK